MTLRARPVDYFSRSQSRPHGLWFPELLVDRGGTAVIWEAAVDVLAWSCRCPGTGRPRGEAEGKQGAERPGGACVSTVCASVCRALGGQAWTLPCGSLLPRVQPLGSRLLLCLSITVPENAALPATVPRGPSLIM